MVQNVLEMCQKAKFIFGPVQTEGQNNLEWSEIISDRYVEGQGISLFSFRKSAS